METVIEPKIEPEQDDYSIAHTHEGITTIIGLIHINDEEEITIKIDEGFIATLELMPPKGRRYIIGMIKARIKAILKSMDDTVKNM